MLFFIGAAASLAAPEASLLNAPQPSPAADAANASSWTSISGDATMTAWCNTNCAAGFCPDSKCVADEVPGDVAVLPSPKPVAPVAPQAAGRTLETGWGDGAFSQADAERQNVSTALSFSHSDTVVSDTAPAESQDVTASLSAEEEAPKKKGKRGGGKAVRAERRHERRAAKKESWEARVAAAQAEAEQNIELEEKTENKDFEDAIEMAKVGKEGAVRFPPETEDSSEERDASEEEAAVRLAAKRREEMKADQAKMEQAKTGGKGGRKKPLEGKALEKQKAFQARVKYDDDLEEEAGVRLAAKRRAEMQADQAEIETLRAYRKTPEGQKAWKKEKAAAAKVRDEAEADDLAQFMDSQKVHRKMPSPTSTLASSQPRLLSLPPSPSN